MLEKIGGKSIGYSIRWKDNIWSRILDGLKMNIKLLIYRFYNRGERADEFIEIMNTTIILSTAIVIAKKNILAVL
jgi:hypothetical protein